MIQVIGNKVCQVCVFGMVPALFDRIEVGGVGGQPLEVEPCGMTRLKIGRRGSMYAPTIPNHDHLVAIMAMQLTEQPHRIDGVNILRQKLEIE